MCDDLPERNLSWLDMIRSRYGFPDKTLYLTLWTGIAIAVLFSTYSLDAIYILAPVGISISICIWFTKSLCKKDDDWPVVDIGMFCVVYTTLYATVPLLNFFFGGLNFGELSDGRLQTHNPSAQELGIFFINHVIYLGSLACAYLIFRKSNRALPLAEIEQPKRSLVIFLAGGFGLLFLYFLFFLLAFEVGFKSGYGDHIAVSEGSVFIQQLNGRLSGIHDIFYAAVLAYLVLFKNNWRVIIYAAVAWGVLSSILWPGSRGEFMTLILLSTLFWHKFHGIKLRFLVQIAIGGLAYFAFIGMYRSYDTFSGMVSQLDSFQIFASSTNEFQSMLGTGFDVLKKLENGLLVPPVLYLNDFIPMLPPQQFLPFEKISGANWYLMEINYFGTGDGFMWSVISQSLIGFGFVELALRGMVLGWILALIHSWYQTRYTKFLPSVIYVNLCITTYLTFRDTTGAILWQIWWAVIPFAILIYIFGFRTAFEMDDLSKWMTRHLSDGNNRRPYRASSGIVG